MTIPPSWLEGEVKSFYESRTIPLWWGGAERGILPNVHRPGLHQCAPFEENSSCEIHLISWNRAVLSGVEKRRELIQGPNNMSILFNGFGKGRW
jgi:hypothetical protein